MKKIFRCLGRVALSGLAILLPLLLLYVLLDEVFMLIVALATPVAEVILPGKVIDAINMPVLLAIVVLFVVSVLIGLLARTDAGRRFGSMVERNTVSKLPVYAALKGIGTAIVGGAGRSGFEPVLINYEDGTAAIVYLVEDIDDDRVAILEPWVPTPFAGSMKIVPRRLISPMEASLMDVSAVLSRWGVGTRTLFVADRSPGAAARDDEAAS
jgi:uncharacterized membrane protein